MSETTIQTIVPLRANQDATGVYTPIQCSRWQGRLEDGYVLKATAVCTQLASGADYWFEYVYATAGRPWHLRVFADQPSLVRIQALGAASLETETHYTAGTSAVGIKAFLDHTETTAGNIVYGSTITEETATTFFSCVIGAANSGRCSPVGRTWLQGSHAAGAYGATKFLRVTNLGTADAQVSVALEWSK